MTNAKNRRYARVYFDDLERDHPEIWFDPTCLSTWLRLLSLSEKSWPTMPELPRSVRRADLEKLVRSGMLELLDNHRFVLRGWLKEREERSSKAIDAVSQRRDRVGSVVPTLVPTDVPTDVPTNDLHTRAHAGARAATASASSYSSSTEEGSGEKPPDAADAYWTLTGRYPTDKPISWIDDMAATFGTEATIRALATAHAQDSRTNTLLGRTQDILRAQARALSVKEQAAERQRQKDRRPTEQTPEQRAAIEAEIRRMLAA